MGEALIRGFCEAGITGADRLAASVRSAERQKQMTSLGVRVFGDATRGGAEELAASSDIIVLGEIPATESRRAVCFCLHSVWRCSLPLDACCSPALMSSEPNRDILQ